MEFILKKRDQRTNARLGVMKTPHGEVHTPAFIPVGTSAVVKTLTPRELLEIGAEIILGNTYHISLRPGIDIIKSSGGLHKFMGWDRPLLTDSGGFQLFSLATLRKITEEGVYFQSHIDGASCFFGPEEVISIQNQLGSDIIMALDECVPYPKDYDYTCNSLEITLKWEKKCRILHRDERQALFGIVQGGVYKDLRERAAKKLVELDFDGYAIGGLSVGEPEEIMYELVEFTVQFLPEDKPRYLMGSGNPLNILEVVGRGIDMFDCVLPTRNGRNGSAFTSEGILTVKSGRYKEDFSPIEKGCGCYACQNFSRAYIRHLMNVGEILGPRLITLHNLYFYLDLMRRIREAIDQDKFDGFKEDFYRNYKVIEEEEVV